TGPQSIHILRGVRQQQDEPGRFSICSRQAAVVLYQVIDEKVVLLVIAVGRRESSEVYQIADLR
ncbi:type II toxin-antitoxin system RelE family toxin, partial [Escherichia coli]|uniref:type II toxin-antitoxin system RelE family toxin n=1 Tax=Escherichia coli TaxID=562 RepID=UPI00309D4829